MLAVITPRLAAGSLLDLFQSIRVWPSRFYIDKSDGPAEKYSIKLGFIRFGSIRLMSRAVPFDILVAICAELAAATADEQEKSGKEWDNVRYNDRSISLLRCSLISKDFREAAAPFVFRTINLCESWSQIQDRVEALRSSEMLKRYVW